MKAKSDHNEGLLNLQKLRGDKMSRRRDEDDKHLKLRRFVTANNALV